MITGPTLEAEHKANAQGFGDSLERPDTRLVATALQPGDSRVAGPDPLSQLLLGDSPGGPVFDHEPGQLLELSQAPLFSTIGVAPASPSSPRLCAT
jgi:hypothetical protein